MILQLISRHEEVFLLGHSKSLVISNSSWKACIGFRHSQASCQAARASSDSSLSSVPWSFSWSHLCPTSSLHFLQRDPSLASSDSRFSKHSFCTLHSPCKFWRSLGYFLRKLTVLISACSWRLDCIILHIGSRALLHCCWVSLVFSARVSNSTILLESCSRVLLINSEVRASSVLLWFCVGLV